MKQIAIMRCEKNGYLNGVPVLVQLMTCSCIAWGQFHGAYSRRHNRR